jgi:hypothetical protein
MPINRIKFISDHILFITAAVVGHSAKNWLMMIITTTTAWLISYAIFRLLRKPFVNFLKRVFTKKFLSKFMRDKDVNNCYDEKDF